MAVVAMTSVKGAPGVTTAALALTSAWPVHRRAVLVEADPAGGDIAARFGICPAPGLASLATCLRHERSSGTSGTLTQHAQELPGGVRVLVEPVSRTEARSALEIVADSLSGLAEAESVDLIVDCGRLETGDHVSPTLESGAHTTVPPIARHQARRHAFRCQARIIAETVAFSTSVVKPHGNPLVSIRTLGGASRKRLPGGWEADEYRLE